MITMRLFSGFRSRQALLLAGLLCLAGPVVGLAQGAPGWLLLRSDTADSVFAADPGEKNRLAEAGWKIDGEVRFLAATEPGAKALHRLARAGIAGTDRMLTPNADEVAACVQEGFADEGVLGSVALTQTRPEMIPVFRYRKGKKNLWLIDPGDRPWAEKNGWKLDGPAFWVLPAAKAAGT
jgi:hypothetical protein